MEGIQPYKSLKHGTPQSGPPLAQTLGLYMNYSALFEQLLSAGNGQSSLAELLRAVDAVNRSTPSYEEASEVMAQLVKNGSVAPPEWAPISRSQYSDALSENQRHLQKFLSSRGASPENQQEALRNFREVWKLDET